MEYQIPCFLLKCSDKEKQEKEGVLLCTSARKHEHRYREGVLVAFKEMSVPEYVNAPLLLWCLHPIQMYTNTEQTGHYTFLHTYVFMHVHTDTQGCV